MSKNPIRVANSPLTNTIYAGRIKGVCWSGEKHDVTTDSLVAVAQHTLVFGKPILINENGKPKYEITVKELGGTK